MVESSMTANDYSPSHRTRKEHLYCALVATRSGGDSNSRTYLHFTDIPNKRTFVMEHILRLATLSITLGFAAMGATRARPITISTTNFTPVTQVRCTRRHRALWPWYKPERSVPGLPCDLPSSTCSNDERIKD